MSAADRPREPLGRLEQWALAAVGVGDRRSVGRRVQLVLPAVAGAAAHPLVTALAQRAGVGVRQLDCPRGTAPARDAGRALVEHEADAGTDLLLLGLAPEVGPATATALLTAAEPQEVVGQPPGVDDQAWMRTTAAVRDAMRAARHRLADPVEWLDSLGDDTLAAAVGVLEQAAERRVPVLLDGDADLAAALIARREQPSAAASWLVAHRSPDPGHTRARDRLALVPLLDLGLTPGRPGLPALLALPLLQTAVVVLDGAGE